MIARSVPFWITSVFLRARRRLIGSFDRIVTDGEGRKRCFAGITDRPITIVMNCKGTITRPEGLYRLAQP